MNKYDIIINYCKLECDSNLHIPIDCVSSGQKEHDEKNVRYVESIWKEIWPSTCLALMEMRKRYGFDPNIGNSKIRAKLMLADTIITNDDDWEISFIFEDDGCGEWGIAFNGKDINRELSQPYF